MEMGWRAPLNNFNSGFRIPSGRYSCSSCSANSVVFYRPDRIVIFSLINKVWKERRLKWEEGTIEEAILSPDQKILAIRGRGSLILFDVFQSQKLFDSPFPNLQFVKWISSDLLIFITDKDVYRIESLSRGLVPTSAPNLLQEPSFNPIQTCPNQLPSHSPIFDCQISPSGQYCLLIGDSQRQVSCLDPLDCILLEDAPQCSCLYSHFMGDYSCDTLSSIVKIDPPSSQGSSPHLTVPLWRLTLKELSTSSSQQKIISNDISGLTREDIDRGVTENFLSLVPIQEYYLFGFSYVSVPDGSSTLFTCVGYLFDTKACQTLWKKDLLQTQAISRYFCGRYREKSNGNLEIGNYILRVNEHGGTMTKVVVNETDLLQCLERSHSWTDVSRIKNLRSQLMTLQNQNNKSPGLKLNDSDISEQQDAKETFSLEVISQGGNNSQQTSSGDDTCQNPGDDVSQNSGGDVPENSIHKDLTETIEGVDDSSKTSRIDSPTDISPSPPDYVVKDSPITTDITEFKGSLGILRGHYTNDTGTLTQVVIKLDSTLRALDQEDQILKYLAGRSSSEGCDCPSIKSYFFHQNYPRYLVLESHGEDLRSYFVPRSKETRLILARLILEALSSIHEYGIMHGDIKPANVLVVGLHGAYVVKFCDFDSSRLLTDEEPKQFPTLDGDLKYSAGWEAPEVHFGTPGELCASRSIDIFSTGLLLYVLFQDWVNKYSTGLPVDSPHCHGSDEEAKLHRSEILSSQKSIEDYLKVSEMSTSLHLRLVYQMCLHDPSARRSAREYHGMYQDFSATAQHQNYQALKKENEILKETLTKITPQQIANEAMATTTSRDQDLISVIKELLEKANDSNCSHFEDLRISLQQQSSDTAAVTQRQLADLKGIQQTSRDDALESLKMLPEVNEILRIVRKLDNSQETIESQLALMRSSNDKQLRGLSHEIDSFAKSFDIFQNSLDSSLATALEKSLIVDVIVGRTQAAHQQLSDAFRIQQDNSNASFLELKKSILDSLEQQSTIFGKLDLLICHSDSISSACGHLTELAGDSKVTQSEYFEMSKQILSIISDLNQTTFHNTHLPVYEALNHRMKELEGRAEEGLKSFQDSMHSLTDEREQERQFRLAIMQQLQQIFQEQRDAPKLIRQGIAQELEILKIELEEESEETVREIMAENFRQFGGDIELLLDGGTASLQSSLTAIGTKVTSIDNIQKAQVQGLLSFPQIFRLALSQETPHFKKSKPLSSLSKYISHSLFDYYDLHFICSLCGKKGQRYSIKLTKRSVKKLMKGVSVTLQVIEILGTLFGIPIPHFSKVIKDIFGEIPENVEKTVKKAVNVSRVIHQDLGQYLKEGGDLSVVEEELRIFSRKHQQRIRTLLDQVNDPEATESGLQLISHNNNMVWACEQPDDECQQCRANGVCDLSFRWGEDKGSGHWTQVRESRSSPS